MPAAVRRNGQASLDKWFERESKEEACRRAIATIDAGAIEISSNSPMYDELNVLTSWAQ